jgi:hypothetical protein
MPKKNAITDNTHHRQNPLDFIYITLLLAKNKKMEQSCQR